MEPSGRPMTSAATPDFQHSPSPTAQAERKKGATWGRYRYRSRRAKGTWNTSAISVSLWSMLEMPPSTFWYTMGATMRKEMTTDRFRRAPIRAPG